MLMDEERRARTPIAGAVALVALALVSSCTPASGPLPAPEATPVPAPGEVVIAVPVGPQHLDPDGTLDEYTASILVNTYEWLVTLDAQLRPVGMLAQRWTTLDERTWVFELRRGVRFHDGRVLDAPLAVEAIRRAIARRYPENLRISQVEARGDHEIVVTTTEPKVAVIDVVDVPIALEPLTPSGAPVGTGAYTIVAGGPLETVRLQAFADHWAGPAAVPSVEFRVIPDEWQRLRALREGEVHLTMNLSAAGAATVTEIADARLVRQGSLRTVFLGLVGRPGGRVASTPFDDVRVRQAVASALNRAALVEEVLGGQAEVVDQIVSPEIFGYVPDLEPIAYDPEASRRLLREAGHPDGFGIELSYPAARYQAIESVAEAVVEDLAEVGIVVTPRAEGPTAIAQAEASTAAFLMGWITSHSALASYGQLFHTPEGVWGSANQARHSDPELDAALARAAVSGVDGQRRQLVAAGRRLRETLPAIPLYRQVDLYGVHRSLAFEPRPQRLILARELRWAESATD